MATDNSPPKIRVILTIAFSSVVILGALNFVFRSYFQMMTDEAEHSHLRPAEPLLKLREGEQKNLTTGALPIDKAMADLASKGRESDGFKDIAPQQSTDLGPMVGWLKAPNMAMVEKINAMADVDAGAAPAVSGDGGVVGDGGDAGPSATATDAKMNDAGVVVSDAGKGTATTTAIDAGAAPKASSDAGVGPTPSNTPGTGNH